MTDERMEVDGAEARERLLDAYLAGELDGEARRRIESWLHARPEERAAIDRFVAGSAGLDARVRVPSPEEIVRGVRERVRTRTMESRSAGTSAQQDRGERLGRPEERRTSWGGQGRCLCVLGFCLREGGRCGGGRHSLRGRMRSASYSSLIGIVTAAMIVMVIGVHALRHVVPATPSQTYTTSVAQQRSVMLVDGTRVTLAPQSVLAVAAGFSASNRTVTLRGRAYFEVAHASGQPFAVHTGNIVTRVLGTAFDVVHYADDRDVRIAVTSGRVAVTAPQRPAVTLVSRTIGWITDSTMLVAAIGDVTPYSEWMHGSLEFHAVPIRDVLRIVGHWYGVHVELTDTVLAAQPITTFLNSADMHKAMSTLETLLDVVATSQATTNGPVITLRPRVQAARPAVHRRDTQAFSPNTEVGR